MSLATLHRIQHSEFDFFERREAPLRADLESADRDDFVAEQLDADWAVPVGCEHVEDSATPGKLSG